MPSDGQMACICVQLLHANLARCSACKQLASSNTSRPQNEIRVDAESFIDPSQLTLFMIFSLQSFAILTAQTAQELHNCMHDTFSTLVQALRKEGLHNGFLYIQRHRGVGS